MMDYRNFKNKNYICLYYMYIKKYIYIGNNYSKYQNTE